MWVAVMVVLDYYVAGLLNSVGIAMLGYGWFGLLSC